LNTVFNFSSLSTIALTSVSIVLNLCPKETFHKLSRNEFWRRILVHKYLCKARLAKSGPHYTLCTHPATWLAHRNKFIINIIRRLLPGYVVEGVLAFLDDMRPAYRLYIWRRQFLKFNNWYEELICRSDPKTFLLNTFFKFFFHDLGSYGYKNKFFCVEFKNINLT
jgi:hypothetical protein